MFRREGATSHKLYDFTRPNGNWNTPLKIGNYTAFVSEDFCVRFGIGQRNYKTGNLTLSRPEGKVFEGVLELLKALYRLNCEVDEEQEHDIVTEYNIGYLLPYAADYRISMLERRCAKFLVGFGRSGCENADSLARLLLLTWRTGYGRIGKLLLANIHAAGHLVPAFRWIVRTLSHRREIDCVACDTSVVPRDAEMVSRRKAGCGMGVCDLSCIAYQSILCRKLGRTTISKLTLEDFVAFANTVDHSVPVSVMETVAELDAATIPSSVDPLVNKVPAIDPTKNCADAAALVDKVPLTVPAKHCSPTRDCADVAAPVVEILVTVPSEECANAAPLGDKVQVAVPTEDYANAAPRGDKVQVAVPTKDCAHAASFVGKVPVAVLTENCANADKVPDTLPTKDCANAAPIVGEVQMSVPTKNCANADPLVDQAPMTVSTEDCANGAPFVGKVPVAVPTKNCANAAPLVDEVPVTVPAKDWPNAAPLVEKISAKVPTKDCPNADSLVDKAPVTGSTKDSTNGAPFVGKVPVAVPTKNCANAAPLVDEVPVTVPANDVPNASPLVGKAPVTVPFKDCANSVALANNLPVSVPITDCVRAKGAAPVLRRVSMTVVKPGEIDDFVPTAISKPVEDFVPFTNTARVEKSRLVPDSFRAVNAVGFKSDVSTTFSVDTTDSLPVAATGPGSVTAPNVSQSSTAASMSNSSQHASNDVEHDSVTFPKPVYDCTAVSVSVSPLEPLQTNEPPSSLVDTDTTATVLDFVSNDITSFGDVPIPPSDVAYGAFGSAVPSQDLVASRVSDPIGDSHFGPVPGVNSVPAPESNHNRSPLLATVRNPDSIQLLNGVSSASSDPATKSCFLSDFCPSSVSIANGDLPENSPADDGCVSIPVCMFEPELTSTDYAAVSNSVVSDVSSKNVLHANVDDNTPAIGFEDILSEEEEPERAYSV